MKKMLLMLVFFMGVTCVNAQDVVDRCISELEPIIAKAKAVWHDGNSHYGMTSERAERYVIYCLEAGSIMDKYVDQIADVNDQLGLLWEQVDMLSDILGIYEDNKMGLSASEYTKQADRKVSTLQKMAFLCKKIGDKADRDLEFYNINEALAEHHCNRGNYKEASLYYSSCISNYTDLLSSKYASDDDVRKAGQKAYYWMGYTAYKLGDTTIANHYFNKAKDILNDELIQPYK